jgi:hypothetical protein
VPDAAKLQWGRERKRCCCSAVGMHRARLANCGLGLRGGAPYFGRRKGNGGAGRGIEKTSGTGGGGGGLGCWHLLRRTAAQTATTSHHARNTPQSTCESARAIEQALAGGPIEGTTGAAAAAATARRRRHLLESTPRGSNASEKRQATERAQPTTNAADKAANFDAPFHCPPVPQPRIQKGTTR